MSKAERTKNFILEKTAPVFNIKGYAGTSLTDMTEVTKLTKGSIYGNFANKDEVALAAFDHNLNKVSSLIRHEMSKHESSKEKLLTYHRIYNDFADYPFPAGGCPILNTAIEADDTHPELRKRAMAAINSWKNKIVGLIEKGMENGEFRKGINAEQTALTLIALIEGGIMISKATGKSTYHKAIMKSIEQLIEQMTLDI